MLQRCIWNETDKAYAYVPKRGMSVVDEKKIGLMTKVAIYEKHEKHRNLVVSKYYETDYVRYNVLKTWVAATVAYWTIVGSYLFMKFDDLLAKINDIDYFDLMYRILGAYALFCIAYFLLSSAVYHYRYIKSKPGLVEYNSNLRDLIELEGGPMHRGKLAENARVGTTANEDTVKKQMTGERSPQKNAGTRVNRSEIVKKRIQEEEQRKEAEILENVKQRNARIAAQNEEKLRQQRQAEEDRRRIQERRKQLEKEQMERIRNERMQQMQRDNHVYNNNSGNKEGRDN